MKQFNLEEYLKNPSRKVVTKDGRNARIVCTDKKGVDPIVALVTKYDSVTEEAFTYTKNGEFIGGIITKYDLFFAPEKHEGWVRVYRDVVYNEAYCGRIYASKEEAECHSNNSILATVKIEWEE